MPQTQPIQKDGSMRAHQQQGGDELAEEAVDQVSALRLPQVDKIKKLSYKPTPW